MPGTVLFLSHDASRSGAPIMLLNFLRWLRQNRAVQFRILIGNSGDLIADFEAVGAVDTFEPDRTFWYKALRRLKCNDRYLSYHRARLRERLLNSDIRLVYANSVASAPMLEFLSFLNCPVICHVHEPAMSIRKLGTRALDLVKSRTSVYIAVSQSVKENLSESYQIPEDKIHLLLGSIPILEQPKVRDLHRDLRRELAIPATAKIVCGCGSIEFRKGTDIFLEVASHVSRKNLNFPVHFIWVGGEAAMIRRVRMQTVSSSLNNLVHFVGQTSSVIPYFEASDIFLLTSREESLSLVMLEAALCERPIICFDQSGHPPEFVEQDAGFVVPGFDSIKMGDRLIELLSNPDLCRRLGMGAKSKLLTKYNFDVSASKIANVIEDMIDGTTARR